MAAAKSDIATNFETQLKTVQAQADAEQRARRRGEQSVWMMPAANGWNGNLFDFAGLARPFDRSQANAWFVDALKDAGNAGTVGDMIVTTTQIDYLAIMERSFRMRHTMRRPRAILHMLARKAGHGHNNGPLVQAALEYVRGLVKQNKRGA